jgi:two-component system nitrogen regulation sensor histidine kinase NtrY
VIRRDLSLYWTGRLVSTSRRDLFQAGVLGERLPAPVARDLLAEGHPTVQRPLVLAGRALPVVYGSLALPGERGRGVAAIPLTVPHGGLQRRAAAVDEVILLGMVTTLLLLGAIAVRTARRMSDPIRQLSRATEALAGGDLRARVEGRAAEEIGALMESFNRMAENLERQRADLEQRKHYIETILNNATTGVVSTDSRGRIRTLNPAARELLHLDRAREGDRLPGLLERAPGLGALSRDLEESLRVEGGRREREVDRPGPTPEDERRLRTVILPLDDPTSSTSGRVLLVEDVTETARSERLAAWAEMARRIAHEIKNPLTPISLVVEHLRRLRQADDPELLTTLPRALDTIVEQVRALRMISAEFSAYARLPEMATEPMDPGRFVATVVAPYATAPPRNLEILQSYQDDLPPVMVDDRVLTRALVNLLENALQALAGRRGIVEVRVDRDPEREGWVRIRVRDDGEGMDRDTLSRLFDPYFSTRDAGTGLGLPIARRAVEQHGGVLGATSSPGRGTTMTLSLPPAPD